MERRFAFDTISRRFQPLPTGSRSQFLSMKVIHTVQKMEVRMNTNKETAKNPLDVRIILAVLWVAGMLSSVNGDTYRLICGYRTSRSKPQILVSATRRC